MWQVFIYNKCEGLVYPQGHHFQNLVPASWIPAGTFLFHFVVKEGARSFIIFTHYLNTLQAFARDYIWIAQRKPLRCFYSITGVIINRCGITPKSVHRIFAPLGTSSWQPKLGPSCAVQWCLWIFSTLWVYRYTNEPSHYSMTHAGPV